MTDDLELLTIRQVTELTAIPENTLYDLIQTRELPALHFGRRIRIRRSTLEQWLEAKEGHPRRLATSDKVLSINARRTGDGSRSSR